MASAADLPRTDDDAPKLISYVDSVKLTMASVRELGLPDALLTASYRQCLDLAAQLDLGRDMVSLHKEFRLAISAIITLAENRRIEIEAARNRPLDLLSVIALEAEASDAELERQMAGLPAPPPSEHEPNPIPTAQQNSPPPDD